VRDAVLEVGPATGRLVCAGAAVLTLTADFELTAELQTEAGAVADLWMGATDGEDRPAVKVRVDNRAAAASPATGSLAGLRQILPRVVRDGEWFILRCERRADRLRTWVDGELLVDASEVSSVPIRGDLLIEFLSGGPLRVRRLAVRPLPSAGSPPGPLPAPDPRIRALHAAGFPVLNRYVHLKGGLTLDRALELSRATGIGYGIAVNVGLGFPTTNSAAVRAWADGLRGRPVFVGMQAEGREWTRLVDLETAARFGYVFTDAMTWSDRGGRRMRLWMPDEVAIGDPQEFMDTLVDRTVDILETEPIDIYANPTYLPAVLMPDYDRLWTEDRMRRVTRAAVARNVAIEINARLRLPRPPFLRMAKAAGAKFTFGTNNAGADVGDLGYCLDMAAELALAPSDMFVPIPGRSAACRRLAEVGGSP